MSVSDYSAAGGDDARRRAQGGDRAARGSQRAGDASGPTGVTTTRSTGCCTRPACWPCARGRSAAAGRDWLAIAQQRRLETPKPTRPLLASTCPTESAPGWHWARCCTYRALLPVVHVHSRVRLLRRARRRAQDRGADALEAARVISDSSSATRCARASAWWRFAGTTRRLRPRASARSRTSSVSSRREQPLVDEAVAASGGCPGGTPSKIAVRSRVSSAPTPRQRPCLRRCSR